MYAYTNKNGEFLLGGTKTISLSEDAYLLLKDQKRKNESFSEVVLRLLGPKEKKLSDLAGTWKDVPDEDIDEMKQQIREMRRRWP